MIDFLRLLHLGDSALPIGGVSHSLGLESLVEDGNLSVPALYGYWKELLTETLLVDAVYCRQAHREPAHAWGLNDELNALRPARETREASLALGKRFVELLSNLEQVKLPIPPGERVHICLAFGCGAAVIGLNADLTVAALLHQTVLNSISAAQRLLSLGQLEGSMLAWDLKRDIEAAAKQSVALDNTNVGSFSHLPELAAFRHPFLTTRLFIS